MTAPDNALLDAARAKAREGGRLSRDEAVALSLGEDFHTLAHLAHARRMALHPEPVVTYVVDRNINYSNVCVCGCKFCAYFAGPGDERGFVLSEEELDQKIEETIAVGGTQILMQGGHHPDLPFSWYEEMLARIKERHAIHVHAFSPPEIAHFAKTFGLSTREVVKRLKAAGLDSIPGGGAEILVDRVRSAVAPNKCSSAEWLRVMEEAHEEGLRTSATMMFGHLETPEERIDHMLALREVQDRTHGFTAFIPWTFQPENTALSQCRPLTAPEYLRTLAVSRLVLDNFENLQVSWVTMGARVAQLALFFGANDFGSTMLEENVVAAAGVRFRLSEEEIRRVVRAAGFEPRRRLMDYSPAPAEYAD
ncbi:menaquinone biosynthesis protein [Desulfovibrio sp. X2]|uniref:cyclic dehypoxanthinyl futalosine synthase n=1 Tax=Desulfovibrio sp. X2 TaxID=941449 RepID=UPI0003587988|nr:cyclic dehypoxanthinyl futalosine synthase [Desulfovibrio sp. X2]EPR43578.1 menaquinone biosynthesis protein [Desulfovibrio sp. X2]